MRYEMNLLQTYWRKEVQTQKSNGANYFTIKFNINT